jgi:hypothetical protein
MKRVQSLAARYPPSEPCNCEVCLAYCRRPGWWPVKEAAAALEAGYGSRMMLELAPDRSFGVLAPAFRGCEGTFALEEFSARGCGFLGGNLCQLHGTGHQPLECRFCHHGRRGEGPRCHADLERDWDSPAGRALVARWCRVRGLWEALSLYGLERLKPAGQRARG